MKSYTDFLKESLNITGTYIAVIPDEITAVKLTQYQEENLKGQDLEEELHCTLIYSKSELKTKLELLPTSYTCIPMGFDLFGPNKDILVLKIKSLELKERNTFLTKEHNFVSDYDEYLSHITLAFNYKECLSNLPDIDFMIVLNGEYIEDIKVDAPKNEEEELSDTLIGKELKRSIAKSKELSKPGNTTGDNKKPAPENDDDDDDLEKAKAIIKTVNGDN